MLVVIVVYGGGVGGIGAGRCLCWHWWCLYLINGGSGGTW